MLTEQGWPTKVTLFVIGLFLIACYFLPEITNWMRGK